MGLPERNAQVEGRAREVFDELAQGLGRGLGEADVVNVGAQVEAVIGLPAWACEGVFDDAGRENGGA